LTRKGCGGLEEAVESQARLWLAWKGCGGLGKDAVGLERLWRAIGEAVVGLERM
jgi:hypothetical protein